MIHRSTRWVISALDLDNITSGQGAVVLDARERRILLQTSTPNSPQRLVIANLSRSGAKTIIQDMPLQRPSHIHFKSGRDMGPAWPADTAASLQSKLAGMKWKIQEHTPSSTTTNSDIFFQSILLLPPGAAINDDRKIPLILVPHGGPHGCMPTSFVPSYAYLSMTLSAQLFCM